MALTAKKRILGEVIGEVNVALMEERLSDGSTAYEVHLFHEDSEGPESVVEIWAADYQRAVAMFYAILAAIHTAQGGPEETGRYVDNISR